MNVKVDVLPSVIAVGLNDLLIAGGPTTVMPAVAVLPVPPLLDDTFPVVLVYTPAVVPVTVTGKVHGTPGATEAPLREMVRVAAVVVSVPLHVGVEESATLKPAGKVSLKPTPANVAVLFVLLIVNVKVDVLPWGIDAGLNPLLIEGGDTTVMPADAVLPVPPLLDETFPVVLVYTPAVVPVTVTLNVHGTPGATVAPLNEMVRVAAVVVRVPPQTDVLLSATLNPTGKVSLKVTPFSVEELLGLVIVNVNVEVLPCGIDAGLNPLLIEGGAITVRFAVAVLPVPPLVDETFPVVFV